MTITLTLEDRFLPAPDGESHIRHQAAWDALEEQRERQQNDERQKEELAKRRLRMKRRKWSKPAHGDEDAVLHELEVHAARRRHHRAEGEELSQDLGRLAFCLNQEHGIHPTAIAEIAGVTRPAVYEAIRRYRVTHPQMHQ